MVQPSPMSVENGPKQIFFNFCKMIPFEHDMDILFFIKALRNTT
jgi:hypothetical protein